MDLLPEADLRPVLVLIRSRVVEHGCQGPEFAILCLLAAEPDLANGQRRFSAPKAATNHATASHQGAASRGQRQRPRPARRAYGSLGRPRGHSWYRRPVLDEFGHCSTRGRPQNLRLPCARHRRCRPDRHRRAHVATEIATLVHRHFVVLRQVTQRSPSSQERSTDRRACACPSAAKIILVTARGRLGSSLSLPPQHVQLYSVHKSVHSSADSLH